jgi:superfamily II DNA/RNA helicase
LWKILQDLPDKARVVIFANTKRRVDYLEKGLWDEGLGTTSIHGDKQQQERDKALRMFIAGERPIMIATDVAARGLDIKGVTHVINFDMARDVESYIHRIGRTGRAGELGASITFWNPDYDKECTPALIKIARDAQQEVPEWLAKFENTKANKLWKVEKAVLA